MKTFSNVKAKAAVYSERLGTIWILGYILKQELFAIKFP
jgi:hypothetical protein